ncbi:MAG TPA: 16S rRNA (adenine(1518)-N(6)/adenine(1519)-N(6))-dimethyltransferase RsmA [Candidatus Paceibacterota bacterium]|nr:16S rRNA (adenine(1518)-N(6)/adenine(1519)-N(6))-dimethyltransferase RsmA [Candidatus Paceibacterota bacterium]
MTRLGQNFLIDRTVLGKIAAAARPPNGAILIEIGPGHGELTDELRRRYPAVPLIAIEKDLTLAKTLATRRADDTLFKLQEGDVRQLLPSLVSERTAPNKPYVVAGNIPYYLTGFLFRLLGELLPRPKCIVLTIQKEVAERVAAQPPQMNRLAASIQFWAWPTIKDIIPKKAFRPVPKVDSAILLLEPHPLSADDMPAEAYYELVRVLFQQPRKTILNNLCARYPKDDVQHELERLGLDQNLRPQNLDTIAIRELARGLAKREL